GDEPAGGDIPDARGIVTRRDDAGAIRTERGARHLVPVLERSIEGLAGGRVPDARGPVGARGDDADPVGAERGAQYLSPVVDEGGEELARGGVPDPHHVVARREHAGAVGAERGPSDPRVMVER